MSKLALLGANIKKYGEAKGLTQLNLAVKLGLSYEYICRVERGQKFMSLRKLFELVDTLGIKFSDITNFE